MHTCKLFVNIRTYMQAGKFSRVIYRCHKHALLLWMLAQSRFVHIIAHTIAMEISKQAMQTVHFYWRFSPNSGTPELLRDQGDTSICGVTPHNSSPPLGPFFRTESKPFWFCHSTAAVPVGKSAVFKKHPQQRGAAACAPPLQNAPPNASEKLRHEKKTVASRATQCLPSKTLFGTS